MRDSKSAVGHLMAIGTSVYGAKHFRPILRELEGLGTSFNVVKHFNGRFWKFVQRSEALQVHNGELKVLNLIQRSEALQQKVLET